MTNPRRPARARSGEEVPGHEDPDPLHQLDDPAHEGSFLGDSHAADADADAEDAYDVDEDGYDVHELDYPTDDDDVMSGGQRDGRTRAKGPVRAVRRVLVLLVALSLVAVAAFAAVSVLKPMFDGLGGSNDFAGPGSGSVQVVVNPGDTGRNIGTTLESAGVV